MCERPLHSLQKNQVYRDIRANCTHLLGRPTGASANHQRFLKAWITLPHKKDPISASFYGINFNYWCNDASDKPAHRTKNADFKLAKLYSNKKGTIPFKGQRAVGMVARQKIGCLFDCRCAHLCVCDLWEAILVNWSKITSNANFPQMHCSVVLPSVCILKRRNKWKVFTSTVRQGSDVVCEREQLQHQ